MGEYVGLGYIFEDSFLRNETGSVIEKIVSVNVIKEHPKIDILVD